MRHTPSLEKGAVQLCPKCLGLGGWPCDSTMPHYALTSEPWPDSESLGEPPRWQTTPLPPGADHA